MSLFPKLVRKGALQDWPLIAISRQMTVVYCPRRDWGNCFCGFRIGIEGLEINQTLFEYIVSIFLFSVNERIA